MNEMIVSMIQSQGSIAQIAAFFNAIRNALLSTSLSPNISNIKKKNKKSMLCGKKLHHKYQ